MKENLSLLYMGKSLSEDRILRENLHRQAKALGWCIIEERMLPALEPDTPLEFRRELEREGRYLLVTDEHSFALAGRILSTLSDRPLLLSEIGILAPAGAYDLQRTGYTLRLGEASVTVLRRTGNDPYPTIPLEERGGRIWHCFPRSPHEETLLLEALAATGEETLEYTRLLPGWIRVRVCGEEALGTVERLLGDTAPRRISRPTLVRAFIEYFSLHGKTLTFAESCTGGRLAAALTGESGSSAILEGSYVTYANRIKSGWLNVREATLEQYGAVSAECVREMAAGAQANLEADLAVAISGIAGPTGAVPGKPVGTVWICVRNGNRETVERLQFSGDRNAVQKQAVRQALKMILESEEKIFEFFAKNS